MYQQLHALYSLFPLQSFAVSKLQMALVKRARFAYTFCYYTFITCVSNLQASVLPAGGSVLSSRNTSTNASYFLHGGINIEANYPDSSKNSPRFRKYQRYDEKNYQNSVIFDYLKKTEANFFKTTKFAVLSLVYQENEPEYTAFVYTLVYVKAV